MQKDIETLTTPKTRLPRGQFCVRYGSKADIPVATELVRFVPGKDITEPSVLAEHISPTSPGRKRQRD